MLKGVYSVQFSTQWPGTGGLVVVDDSGCVNGGDLRYFYQGNFSCSGNNMQATIEVKHYAGKPFSVFGTQLNFTLNLSGRILENGDKFVVEGTFNQKLIQISGKKIADLRE